MRYFDYGKVAKDAGISPRKLASLKAVVRREFPKDDMMFELHMLRVCTAIRDGYVTVEQALADESVAAA
jgi:hypothetical protein